MKLSEFGMWLFLGTLGFALTMIMVYIHALSAGLIYVYGYGNPPWMDTLFSVVVPVSTLVAFLGLVLMYGGDDANS